MEGNSSPSASHDGTCRVRWLLGASAVVARIEYARAALASLEVREDG